MVTVASYIFLLLSLTRLTWRSPISLLSSSICRRRFPGLSRAHLLCLSLSLSLTRWAYSLAYFHSRSLHSPHKIPSCHPSSSIAPGEGRVPSAVIISIVRPGVSLSAAARYSHPTPPSDLASVLRPAHGPRDIEDWSHPYQIQSPPLAGSIRKYGFVLQLRGYRGSHGAEEEKSNDRSEVGRGFATVAERVQDPPARFVSDLDLSVTPDTSS